MRATNTTILFALALGCDAASPAPADLPGWETSFPSDPSWLDGGGDPGGHPQPVVGRIRTLGDATFADDTGPRVLAVAHMGDLVARYMYGHRDEVEQDLADARDAGYHVIRSWWNFNPGVWSNESYPCLMPPIPGKDCVTPDYEDRGVEIIQLVASYGMRLTVGPGGIDQMDTAQEEELFRSLRRIIDRAGHHNVAWLEAVNEPSSVHATSDNDGDNTPEHLTYLVQIAAGGTAILWHLGYWDNNDYQASADYCAPGQSYNYNHGWRGGNVFNKIDRRFTWNRVFVDETGRPWCRLTIDGESVGWPVTGPPLRYVSATENGHEMENPEALALIAGATAVRGMPSHMSGTGVQRFERFADTVGWRQIPWMLRQYPADVATFALVHGGQVGDSRLVVEATTNGNGVLARADQAIADDGRFVALIYNQTPDQAQSFRFRRAATFRACDPGAMVCTEHAVAAGQSFDVSMTWGRVLIGRAQ